MSISLGKTPAMFVSERLYIPTRGWSHGLRLNTRWLRNAAMIDFSQPHSDTPYTRWAKKFRCLRIIWRRFVVRNFEVRGAVHISLTSHTAGKIMQCNLWDSDSYRDIGIPIIKDKGYLFKPRNNRSRCMLSPGDKIYGSAPVVILILWQINRKLLDRQSSGVSAQGRIAGILGIE